MEQMTMKILSKKTVSFLLVLSMIFLPNLAVASSIYIDTNHSEFFEGDTILFNVRINSEGANINAVEGEVLLDHEAGSVSLTDINISGSLFSLWPEKPLPSGRNTRISFAGGTPGGFVSNDAIIFNVVLKLDKTGKVALSPNNIDVYLHDGKGTKDKVDVKGLMINVLPKKPDAKSIDDWSKITLNDKTAPEPFEIYLGQESSVFDGKKFLSFNTTDTGSGISYYEVIEGDLPPTRSNDTYVLQEQSKPVKVTVIAYDSAGNAQESVYTTSPDIVSNIVIIVLIGSILFITLLIVIFKRMRKAKK